MSRAIRHSLRYAFLLSGALSACHWGAKAESFAPAMTPVGARVAIRVRGEGADRVGELYAVDSAGVTLRAERLVHVRWSRMNAMDVARLGRNYDVSYEPQTIDAAHRARLGAVSRFPQGLSGELLARVLAQLGQGAIEEVP